MPKLIQADPAIVERMKGEAMARMAEVPGAWGCTVLLTAQGNLYAEAKTEEDWLEREEQLLARLSQAGDTEVKYFLGDGPSWRMRTGLPELDPRNWETGVLGYFPEGDCYMYKPLRSFQPPKKKVRIDGVVYVHELDMEEGYEVGTGRAAGEITSVVMVSRGITRDDEANFAAALGSSYVRYTDDEHPDGILVLYDGLWHLFSPEREDGKEGL